MPVGEVLQVAGEHQSGQGVLGGDPVELAALHGAFQGDGDAFAGGSGGDGVRLGHHRVEAGAGADLGDAGAHLSAADDSDAPDPGRFLGGAHAFTRTAAARTRWRV